VTARTTTAATVPANRHVTDAFDEPEAQGFVGGQKRDGTVERAVDRRRRAFRAPTGNASRATRTLVGREKRVRDDSRRVSRRRRGNWEYR
jgi:hypothetical protein